MLSQNGSDTDIVRLNISKKLTLFKTGGKYPCFAKCIFATFSFSHFLNIRPFGFSSACSKSDVMTLPTILSGRRYLCHNIHSKTYCLVEHLWQLKTKHFQLLQHYQIFAFKRQHQLWPLRLINGHQTVQCNLQSNLQF